MAHSAKPGEFELIARFLAPLSATEPGAFMLTDDAAVIAPRDGHRLVLTTDTLISGVHFLDDTQPAYIAAKSLRVNLSDLASMGADPDCYLLTLSLPAGADGGWDAVWLDAFSQALMIEQQIFGVVLVGGDTVSTPGPLSVSVTALGHVPDGVWATRSGARPGDIVMVSGTIGDAALGLAALQGALEGIGDAEREVLVERHHRPQPRIAFGRRVAGLVHAMIDVSDGLVQDLGHICETSAVGATIMAERVPLSPAARSVVEARPELMQAVLGGGDDYELLFTLASGDRDAAYAIGRELDLPLSEIGRIEDASFDASMGGSGVVVLDGAGDAITLEHGGWRHF